MTDEEGIRRVLALYSQWCDDGRFDEFAELFTADAEFRVMGAVHVGREAIKAFMAAAQPPQRRGRHVVTNPVIVVDAAGATATAWTDYLFVSPTPPDGSGSTPPTGGFAITNVGRYHDRFVKVDSEWRFAVREIVFLADGVTPDYGF
jgi:uncharacterized protein (TIGR02246 family)